MFRNYYNPKNNNLLNALSSEEYERILPYMELVEMPLGSVIYESGEILHYIYFPMDCIVS